MHTTLFTWSLLLSHAYIGSALPADDEDTTSLSSAISKYISLPSTIATRMPMLCSPNDSDGRSCLKEVEVRQRHCGPKHKGKRCNLGDCCSANGKCGRSEAFCGLHCQPEFGDCYGEDKKPSSPTIVPNLKSERDLQRCGQGFDQAKCGDGSCCSIFGYCGQGKDFCSVPENCQRDFGICDSDAIPKGPELSLNAQSRPHRGKLPYGGVIRGCTEPKTAALGFECGPHNNTMAILNVLGEHDARATFFLSGITDSKGMIDETHEWIDVIKRIIVDGHQIGSNSWSHPHLNTMSREERLTDMARNDRAIANIIGKFPTYMRPPYLECSKDSGCLQDMADLGYHVVGWDVDNHDWNDSMTLDATKEVVDKLIDEREADENIFLVLQDSDERVIELTKHVLEQAQKKEWEAVSFGQCVSDPEEFWYSTPKQIEVGSIANKDDSYGCVASAPGFCGELVPFEDEDSCFMTWWACETQMVGCAIPELFNEHDSVTTDACNDFAHICDDLRHFCQRCSANDPTSCNSNDWALDYPTEPSLQVS